MNGTVTPTETTAATANSNTSTMTPTKSSENGSASGGANGDEKLDEKKPDMSAKNAAQMSSATTTTANLTGEVNGNSQKQSSAFSLPREVTQYSPLLVGKYYIQDRRAVWTGRWGMTEAAFEENGVTSPFEMKSQEDVYIPTCTGSSDIIHPSFADGSLARSSRIENVPASEICPAYFGYETDSSVRSAMPFHSKYTGFFQIQAVKGKPQTVTEKDVEIRFVHDPSLPSHFLVSGSGENRFGLFSLHGSLHKETNELRMYKVYKPKTKEKRTLPRRGRAPKVAAQANTLKLSTKAPAPPVAVVTPPAVAHVPEPVSVVAPRNVVMPSIAYNSPSVVARGRSERKRVAPAHLREENVIEFDRIPHSVKKCHSILKGLMVNPKAGPFLAPVDPVALGIPDYFQVIKEPMDLGTIRQNLEGGYYDDASVFADHVRLVFRNAMLYNAAHSQVHIFAQKLSEDFEKRIKSLNLKAAANEKLGDKHKLVKTKKERKSESSHSSKKVKGGKGAKGNTKRRVPGDDQGLIMSLKEDIERLKATLEQLQPSTVKIVTPKPSKPAARPFKMEDLTEEELNEPMSQMDKARLGADIRSLPQDKINRVLQIIAEAVPVAKLANEHGEVEIDINAFDTRCLRMLEGYVRENGIGRKRKRPTTTKKGKTSPPVNRLKSAKVAALNIRNRQEELKHQLAAIDNDGPHVSHEKRHDHDVVMTDADGGVEADDVDKKDADSSSDSSSSSSDSSDSDSDSDSDSESDTGAPIQRNINEPVLSTTVSFARERTSFVPDFRLEFFTFCSEPLKVENRGAWSLLAQKESSNGKSPIHSEESHTSSLWLSVRSMEQMKQQKEKERSEEFEAQRRREVEQREREKEREREEMERRKQELEAQEERIREERVREAERARAAQRAVEREKLTRDDDTGHHEHTLTEDLESFSSSSFL
ncbi:Transcription initiation factor, partial [Globisporangium splendens]